MIVAYKHIILNFTQQLLVWFVLHIYVCVNFIKKQLFMTLPYSTFFLNWNGKTGQMWFVCFIYDSRTKDSDQSFVFRESGV